MPRIAELERSAPTDLSAAALLRNIWDLALPAMGASMVQILFDLTHAWWVGKLGPISLAALTGASFLVWILFSLTMMINTGMTALIARRFGEQRLVDAIDYARQGFVLAPIAALLLMAVAYPGLPHVLAWMRLEPAVLSEAWSYLRILILGLPLIWLYGMVHAVYTGRGDTRGSLRMVSQALVLNMIFDPLLIHVCGLGLAGAAISGHLARVLGIGWGLYHLHTLGWFGLLRPKMQTALQALRIGLPHAATGTIFCFVFVGLTPIMTRFGPAALAAMGIGQRLETVIYSVLSGFTVACTTLVGHNLGAGRPERAERLVWYAAGQAAAFCACFSLIFWFGAPYVLPFFTSDALTQEYGIAYLRMVGLSLLPYSGEMIFEGAFAGAGNTLPPMLIIVLGTVIRIPLAWFFALHCGLGVNGVWMAVAFSMTLKGAILFLWFRRGHWKKIKI